MLDGKLSFEDIRYTSVQHPGPMPCGSVVNPAQAVHAAGAPSRSREAASAAQVS